jgi:hypothetical protein
VLAGRAGGTMAPGRHLMYGEDTPLYKLFVSMLDRVGAPVERFADSTRPLEGLDNACYQGAKTTAGSSTGGRLSLARHAAAAPGLPQAS